ncbi:hypothetical protein SARC_11129, partial [Sphaeroforma arctica JP610]
YTRKVPFVAYEGVRERYGVHPCDKRRTVEVLQPEFPHVDFTHIDVGEDSLWTPTRETEENVKLRVLAFLKFLGTRAETSIAVVSHNDFLSTFFNVIEGPDSLRGRFYNCERRTVVLTTRWQ